MLHSQAQKIFKLIIIFKKHTKTQIKTIDHSQSHYYLQKYFFNSQSLIEDLKKIKYYRPLSRSLKNIQN